MLPPPLSSSLALLPLLLAASSSPPALSAVSVLTDASLYTPAALAILRSPPSTHALPNYDSTCLNLHSEAAAPMIHRLDVPSLPAPVLSAIYAAAIISYSRWEIPQPSTSLASLVEYEFGPLSLLHPSAVVTFAHDTDTAYHVCSLLVLSAALRRFARGTHFLRFRSLTTLIADAHFFRRWLFGSWRGYCRRGSSIWRVLHPLADGHFLQLSFDRLRRLLSVHSLASPGHFLQLSFDRLRRSILCPTRPGLASVMYSVTLLQRGFSSFAALRHRRRLLLRLGFSSFTALSLRRRFFTSVAIAFPALLPVLPFRRDLCRLVFKGVKTYDARPASRAYARLDTGGCVLVVCRTMRFPALLGSCSRWSSFRAAWARFGRSLVPAADGQAAQRVFQGLFVRPRPVPDDIRVFGISSLAPLSGAFCGDPVSSVPMHGCFHELRYTFMRLHRSLVAARAARGVTPRQLLSRRPVSVPLEVPRLASRLAPPPAALLVLPVQPLPLSTIGEEGGGVLSVPDLRSTPFCSDYSRHSPLAARIIQDSYCSCLSAARIIQDSYRSRFRSDAVITIAHDTTPLPATVVTTSQDPDSGDDEDMPSLVDARSPCTTDDEDDDLQPPSPAFLTAILLVQRSYRSHYTP